MTKTWAIEQCIQFFGLSTQDASLAYGQAGRDYLLKLWQQFPDTFYENPLSILRQEWFHTFSGLYRHEGFWAALPIYGTVLDYGCGTAELARFPWIVQHRQITLVEESQACRSYLAQKYPWQSYPHVRVYAPSGSWHQRPRFDGLVCTDVFEHVPDPLTLQETLWSALRPGGYALLKFENAYPHAGHLQESIAQLPAWWA